MIWMITRTLWLLRLISFIRGESSWLISEKLDGDDTDYSIILKNNDIKYFKHFTNMYMIESVSRVTFELFSGAVTEEEKNFKLAGALNSNELPYDLFEFDDLIKRRNLN